MLASWVLCSATCPAVAGLIYFAHYDGSGARIYNAGMDGSNSTVIVDPGYGDDLALDLQHGHIYWSQNGTRYDPRGIWRANLDGNGVTQLIDVAAMGLFPSGVALDVANGHLYWSATGYEPSGILRANLDGSDNQYVLHLPYEGPGALSLDLANSRMYWADGGPNAIRTANMDGSGVDDIVVLGNDPDYDPFWFHVDTALDTINDHIYWTVDRYGKIQRANLDGSGVTDVLSGVGGIMNLALDPANNHIYWTEAYIGTFNIRRADLDGTNVTDIVRWTGAYPFGGSGLALDTSSNAVPEPSSFVLMLGLVGMGLVGLRRQRTAHNRRLADLRPLAES